MSIPILHRAISTRRAGTRRAGTRRAGTFFRKVRANAWRMQGRSGFSFSPHSQDASEKRPCRRRKRPSGRDLFPKGPGDGQGPFSERSERRAGTFFRKVRANAWRMQGRSGFSFSPHSQDASEKRPCPRRRFGMPRPLVAARQGREAHSAWPQAKASLPKRMLRSMSSPLTSALPAQTSLLVITLRTMHPLKNDELYPAKATNPLSNPL
jgi:hypothetical protein